MAVVYFTLDGTDWASKISTIEPIIKENKPTATSVKGETRSLLSRSMVDSTSIKIILPYLSYFDMSKFQRMAMSSDEVLIEHNLDVPAGYTQVTQFYKTIVKSLDSVLYRVEVVFTSTDVNILADLNPLVPSMAFNLLGIV